MIETSLQEVNACFTKTVGQREKRGNVIITLAR